MITYISRPMKISIISKIHQVPINFLQKTNHFYQYQIVHWPELINYSIIIHRKSHIIIIAVYSFWNTGRFEFANCHHSNDHFSHHNYMICCLIQKKTYHTFLHCISFCVINECSILNLQIIKVSILMMTTQNKWNYKIIFCKASHSWNKYFHHNDKNKTKLSSYDIQFLMITQNEWI